MVIVHRGWWRLKVKRLVGLIVKYFIKPLMRKVGLHIVQPIIGRYLNAIIGTSHKARKTDLITTRTAHLIARRPYVESQKIRIIFLFQSASFWPSWESLWEECKNDSRFETHMLVCDDPIKEKVQFASAQSFLTEKKIDFEHVRNVDICEIAPHIIVVHTPYDGHRPNSLRSGPLSARGFRIVYIPYGIEISDSPQAQRDHFTVDVIENAWRIYTFSENMLPEYRFYSTFGGDAARSYGHPKFDGLLGFKDAGLPEDILIKAAGRKVVLWKVHFPKEVDGILITPSLETYINFARKLTDFQDLFFIFMPHPKFYEQANYFGNSDLLNSLLEQAENAVQFTDDDYRQVLMNCDYYMIDRSALMIEAGITGRPILFMENDNYTEPMTSPVQTIIDTYYKSSSARDMVNFIDRVVISGEDERRDERIAAVKSVILNLDGQSGSKIKEDMVRALQAE